MLRQKQRCNRLGSSAAVALVAERLSEGADNLPVRVRVGRQSDGSGMNPMELSSKQTDRLRCDPQPPVTPMLYPVLGKYLLDYSSTYARPVHLFHFSTS